MRTKKEIAIELLKAKGFLSVTEFIVDDSITEEDLFNFPPEFKQLVEEVNAVFDLDISLEDVVDAELLVNFQDL